MVNNEVVNISDLEREEQANTLDLDSYLFDIPSKQVELPPNINWE